MFLQCVEELCFPRGWKKCLSTHAHTAAAAYKRSYLQLSTVDADMSHARFTHSCLYVSVWMCYCQCVFVIIHSGTDGKPLYLPLTPWHWREISVLELCGYLLPTYPHTIYPYSYSLSPIHLFPFLSIFPIPFLSVSKNVTHFNLLWSITVLLILAWISAASFLCKVPDGNHQRLSSEVVLHTEVVPLSH